MEQITSFDREKNISWVDENLPTPDNKLVLKHYIASVVVYGLVILLLYCNPYYFGMVQTPVKEIFRSFYFSYVLVAPIIYFYWRPKSLWKSHNIEIINYLTRCFFHLPKMRNLNIDDIKNELYFFKPKYFEKQAMMLLFIKVFFGFFMIQAAYNNIYLLNSQSEVLSSFFYNVSEAGFNISHILNIVNLYKDVIYTNLITLLFLFDLSIFSFGYFTELSILNNKIRTVDTSFAGVFFCLICYMPFFAVLQSFVGFSYSFSSVAFDDINSPVTWIFRSIVLLSIFFFVYCSFVLGTKASNLTNRGIVSKFPYNIVRHPAYVMKVFYWLGAVIPVYIVHFNTSGFVWSQYIWDIICQIVSFLITITIYYFRALTEERHLIQDPEYQEYVKKVKYRFIPYVW